MNHPIIIIGAGLAAWTTAREFRKLDSTTPVMLITADSGDFYAKPSLSNAFAQKRGPAQLVTTAAALMAQSTGVTLLPHTRVTGIDPGAKKIRTSGGDFDYAQLVLASGATPIRVPLGGDAANQVQSINSLDDFAAFHQRLEQAASKHILIMGAGLIGCEFANDLSSAGYAVTVVDPAKHPIAALLPPVLAEQLRDALIGQGVDWRFGDTVSAVHSSAPVGDSGMPVHALDVTLSSGARVQADLVLSAIGLKADLSLAKMAGLQCERGIVVDAQLQTSVPHIFALGDAAQYANGRTMPYVMPIMSAAKALAATLSGRPTPVVFAIMPVAVKTPAFPLVVAPPAPGTGGLWQELEPACWQFMDDAGRVHGFALGGTQTKHRAEHAKLVMA